MSDEPRQALATASPRPGGAATRVIRIHAKERVVFGVLAAVAIGLLLSEVLNDARRSLGWFFAAAVVAVLIDGPVRWLSRWMRRGLALVVVFLLLFLAVGYVGYAVFNDLSSEMRKLERQVPAAALEIQKSDRFGKFARDIELSERAELAVDGIGERLTGQARATASSIGAYFAGSIIVLFLLAWLPRFLDSGLAQIRENDRRRRAKAIIDGALESARRYLSVQVLAAIATGVATFGVAQLASLPAPVALGLFVAIFSVVPYFGVLIGSFPLMVLAAGLETTATTLGVVLAATCIQFGCALAMRWVQRDTLYVGPGITLIVGLLGYSAYNIGGALFGIAGAVFVLAIVDAAARPDPSVDEPGHDPLDAMTIE